MNVVQNRTEIRPIREPEPAATRIVARIMMPGGLSVAVRETNLPFRVGRDLASDLCIAGGHVSRVHCEINMINGVLCLVDRSKNGTMVGDRTIKQSSIRITGPIQICLAGDVRFKVLPCDIEGAPPKSKPLAERREGEDRRQEDRRQRSVVVAFDRRRQDNREGGDRRASTQS